MTGIGELLQKSGMPGLNYKLEQLRETETGDRPDWVIVFESVSRRYIEQIFGRNEIMGWHPDPVNPGRVEIRSRGRDEVPWRYRLTALD